MNTPHFNQFQQSDFIQYANNVLEIVSEARAAALQLAPQRMALNQTMQTYNSAWQPNRGSELTPQIAALDTQRDALITGLKALADTWAAYHYEEAKKNAAFLIADRIKGYGERIAKLRYQQETAVVSAIVADLEGELAESVKLLSLSEWVAQLKTVNTAFNTRYMERTQALSGEQEGLMAEYRSTATVQLQALMQLFEARRAVAVADKADTQAAFAAVYNEWNQLTEQYNQSVERFKSTEKESVATENSGQPSSES